MKFKRPQKKKISREEKAQLVYQRLLDASAKIIGRDGYAATSIAKVTEEAGVAQGTFYNYFEDRQSLFDALLPAVGQQLTTRINRDVRDVEGAMDREIARFRAYCHYLQANPGFYRILYEAEVFAPKAHDAHIQRLVAGYKRLLKRENGPGSDMDDEQLEAVTYMLLGMRAYVAMRFARGGEVPGYVIDAYEKLISGR